MNQLQKWFNKLDEPGLGLHRHQQLQQSHQVMTMLVTGWELIGMQEKGIWEPQRKCGSFAGTSSPWDKYFGYNIGVWSQEKAGTQSQAAPNGCNAVRSFGRKVGKETEKPHQGKSPRGEFKNTGKCSISSLTKDGYCVHAATRSKRTDLL